MRGFLLNRFSQSLALLVIVSIIGFTFASTLNDSASCCSQVRQELPLSQRSTLASR